MRTREINSKTAIIVVIFNGLFVNVAEIFDNMQQKMFAKFFGYLNLSWRGGTKQVYNLRTRNNKNYGKNILSG